MGNKGLWRGWGVYGGRASRDHFGVYDMQVLEDQESGPDGYSKNELVAGMDVLKVLACSSRTWVKSGPERNRTDTWNDGSRG